VITWTQYILNVQKYTNPAHSDHMTQYILNVTTKEWLKHLLVTFFGKFKKY
jgi:hypothetical protein